MQSSSPLDTFLQQLIEEKNQKYSLVIDDNAKISRTNSSCIDLSFGKKNNDGKFRWSDNSIQKFIEEKNQKYNTFVTKNKAKKLLRRRSYSDLSSVNDGGFRWISLSDSNLHKSSSGLTCPTRVVSPKVTLSDSPPLQASDKQLLDTLFDLKQKLKKAKRNTTI